MRRFLIMVRKFIGVFMNKKTIPELTDEVCEYLMDMEEEDFLENEDVENVIENGSNHAYYKALVVFHEGNMDDVKEALEELMEEDDEDEDEEE
jgi:hypothetical protein